MVLSTIFIDLVRIAWIKQVVNINHEELDVVYGNSSQLLEEKRFRYSTTQSPVNHRCYARLKAVTSLCNWPLPTFMDQNPREDFGMLRCCNLPYYCFTSWIVYANSDNTHPPWMRRNPYFCDWKGGIAFCGSSLKQNVNRSTVVDVKQLLFT